MEKIAVEICYKTEKVTRKIVHLNNGWVPHDVKVIFNNSSDCNKVKDYMKEKMSHLELTSEQQAEPNELIYKYKCGHGDGDDKYHNLGIDEEFDFTYFDEDRPFDLQLLELTRAYLDSKNSL